MRRAGISRRARAEERLGIEPRPVQLLALSLACVVPLAPGTIAAQPAPPDQIGVTIRWNGEPEPQSITSSDGLRLDPNGRLFHGRTARPPSGFRHFDLEVNYPDGSYPLAIRVHPFTEDIDLTVGLDRPRSCAQTYLEPRERRMATRTLSLRAAFTVGYMINRPTYANSCAIWRYRAAKARYDRYQNAMEQSSFLVIPESIRTAYLEAADDPALPDDIRARRRRDAQAAIAAGRTGELRQFANQLQVQVVELERRGDDAGALERSAVLLEASRDEALVGAIAAEIPLRQLERQTSDLQIRVEEQPRRPDNR